MEDTEPFRPVRQVPLPDEFPGVHRMGEEEEAAVVRICRSRSLFRYYGVDPQGEATAFEREFSAFVGSRYAVAVSSGTAALHTALTALHVGPGQEVIVPAYMWVSVIAAVVNLGAIPVLAEIDDTFCLDTESVRQRITPRTAGIVLVHMSGAPGDAPALARLAQEHGLFLLEDCAQCAGGSIFGTKVGTFGDIAIFSFQVNKNLSSGEAGCIVTDNERLYRRAVACHDAGYSRGEHGALQLEDAESFSWGRGCRLDELRAGILRVQLRRIGSVIQSMQRSKYRLRALIQQYPQVRLRRILDPEGDTSCFLLAIFPDSATAYRVNSRLREHGIATRSSESSNTVLEKFGLHIYFNIPALVQKAGTDRRGTPWTLQENRESIYSYGRGSCPASDGLFARTQLLAIPSCLNGEDEDQILEAFRRTLDSVLPPVRCSTEMTCQPVD